METYLIDATSPEAAYVRGLLDVSTARTPRRSNPCMVLELPVEKPARADSDAAAGAAPAVVAVEPAGLTLSSSGTSRLTAAAAESMAASNRLREAATMYFVLQTSIAMSPSVLYMLFSSSRRLRFIVPSVMCLAAFCCVTAAYAVCRQLPTAKRVALLSWWPAVFVWLHAATVSCVTLVLIDDFIQADGVRPASAVVRSYFWAIHLALTSLNWLIAQLPLRVAFFSEVTRSATYVAAALFVAYGDGVLTWRYGAAVLAEGVACTVAVSLVLELCFLPSATVCAQLEAFDNCPPVFYRVRATLQLASNTLRLRLFNDTPLLDVASVVFLGFFSCGCAYQIFVASPPISLPQAASSLSHVLFILLLSQCVAKLRPTSEASLEQLAVEMSMAAHSHAFTLLRDRLASAGSEAAILRAACDALTALFPGTTACALGAFAEGTAEDVISSLECLGDEPSRRALAESLPANVGAAAPGGAVSSVALACRATHGRAAALVDSRDLGGVAACADWIGAVNAGLPSVQAITAPLNAGHMVVGFVTLHFGLYAAEDRQPKGTEIAILRELSDVVGGAIFVRRALAINRDAFASGMRAAGVPSASTRRASVYAGPDDAAFPASAADVAALAALDESASADLATLRDWTLDAWQLPDAEVQRLVSSMLHAFGLVRRFSIQPTALAAFVSNVAGRYKGAQCHAALLRSLLHC